MNSSVCLLKTIEKFRTELDIQVNVDYIIYYKVNDLLLGSNRHGIQEIDHLNTMVFLRVNDFLTQSVSRKY